jgi:hypothetical protein
MYLLHIYIIYYLCFILIYVSKILISTFFIYILIRKLNIKDLKSSAKACKMFRVAAQRKMRKTKSGVAASEKQEQDNDGYNFRNTGGSVPTTADPRTSNNGRRKDVLASRSIPV